MKRYRTRSIEVEAVRLSLENLNEVYKFLGGDSSGVRFTLMNNGIYLPRVRVTIPTRTHDSKDYVSAEEDDWIAKPSTTTPQILVYSNETFLSMHEIICNDRS